MKRHTFHIPVMGIGFTVDTPLKVARFGIDSVISLCDDGLLERLRKMYCLRYNLFYQEITDKMEDYRAKRITSYLNLINHLVSKQFNELLEMGPKNPVRIEEYISLLPDRTRLLNEFNCFMEEFPETRKMRGWINEHLSLGNIDVNIMTKVDGVAKEKNKEQDIRYNDAHAALRGYARSDLNSSVIFSAGLNPRLYGYAGQFGDFHFNVDGISKKKITIKVSDFRSALIQGKFLAKKGLWVSEYRIESGLNCGGHAFATDGFLLGPILNEFKVKREELKQSVYEIYVRALSKEKSKPPVTALPLKITAQGGVGTAEEHQFLIEHYKIDSIGWGSPFLLVPETTSVDNITMKKLAEAKERDLVLSQDSPLGVPFNNLIGSTKAIEKMALVDEGKPGSPCVKKYLALNKEFSEMGICSASRKYQLLKIRELVESGLKPQDYKEKLKEITDKECLCTGLGTSALLVNNLDTKIEGNSVSVCPGPNMAYFSKIMSLREVIDHIYGRKNVITRIDRPNMFLKELQIYIDYLKNRYEKFQSHSSKKEQQRLKTFVENLNSGMTYYRNLFLTLHDKFNNAKSGVLRDLEESEKVLHKLILRIENLKSIPS